MSKCKRNIILIFGFILIVNSLFFPCNRIHHGFHYGLQEKPTYTLEELLEEAESEKTRRVSSEYVKVFFPLVISRASKYKEYIKWESSVFLLFAKKIKVRTELEKEKEEIHKKIIKSINDAYSGTKSQFIEALKRLKAAKGESGILEFLRKLDSDKRQKIFYILGLKPYSSLSDDEQLSLFAFMLEKKDIPQLKNLDRKIDDINKEINEIYQEKIKEFHEKFGYDPYYHQIRAEGFFIELALLILMGGLAYTTLVGLRAIRLVLRDRIKKRKTGIILSLIGTGVLAAFLPLSISARDETGITLLSIAGITLILVGIGLVIFSFFPEDTNPKK